MADDFGASILTTGRVTAGGSTSGRLETAGDTDWFAISLVAGKAYSFMLESGTTDGLFDPYLKLYTGDGKTLIDESDDANGLDSQIDFVVTASGTYYLEASSGSSGNGVGNYVLTSSSPITDDYTANLLTTGSVSPGGSVTGHLEIAGDSDWFAVSLAAGKQYTFTLESGATGGLEDPLLTLYSSVGASVASNDDSDGLNSEISFTVSVSGTYYLAASSGVNGSGTGSYKLAVSLPVADDYAATTLTAGKVVVGGATTGQLESLGDQDWFSIGLNAGQQYTFALDSAATNALADPFLSLYGNNGTLITSNDDSNGTNSELTFLAPATGTYYLGASSSPHATGTGKGSYKLSASLPLVDDNDIFQAGAEAGSFDGGRGTDTVVFPGNRGTYSIQKSSTATGYAVTGPDGTVTLANIERLEFSDGKVALDLDGNAGTTAKILGAVFGASSVSNKPYVGIGLTLLDAGMSYPDLMQAALSAVGATTHTAVVNLLWTNLIGSAPTTAQAAPYVALLDNGLSAGALGVTAADLDLNTTHINLVGLALTGLEYS